MPEIECQEGSLTYRVTFNEEYKGDMLWIDGGELPKNTKPKRCDFAFFFKERDSQRKYAIYLIELKSRFEATALLQIVSTINRFSQDDRFMAFPENRQNARVICAFNNIPIANTKFQIFKDKLDKLNFSLEVYADPYGCVKEDLN